MRIFVIDGQGGGIGRQLVSAIHAINPQLHIHAIGTNSVATSAMLKVGANSAATGENAVIVACRRADVIAGPIGLVIADALMGEVTPAMAKAIGQSAARRILIPTGHCDTIVAGVTDGSIGTLVRLAADAVIAQTRSEG